MSQPSAIVNLVQPRVNLFVVTHLCALVSTEKRRMLPYFGYLKDIEPKLLRKASAIDEILRLDQVKSQYMIWSFPPALNLISGYEDDYFYSNQAGEIWFAYRDYSESSPFPNQQRKKICKYGEGKYLMDN